MKLDPALHNPDPSYLRSLVEGSGLSQRAAAKAIGIGERTLRYHLAGQTTASYPIQFCLEYLVSQKGEKP